MLLHRGKGRVESRDVGNAVLRVGGDTCTVSRHTLHDSINLRTLGVELDTSNAGGGGLVDDLWSDERVQLLRLVSAPQRLQLEGLRKGTSGRGRFSQEPQVGPCTRGPAGC